MSEDAAVESVQIEGVQEARAGVEENTAEVQVIAPDAQHPEESQGIKGLFLSKMGLLKVRIFMYANKSDNEIQLYTDRQLDDSKVEELGFIKYEGVGEFKIPNRVQLDRIYEKAMKWHPEAGRLLLNRVSLRRQALNLCLVSLELPGSEKFEFGRDSRGRLNEVSEAFLDNLHPSFVEVLTSKFESDAGLLMV